MSSQSKKPQPIEVVELKPKKFPHNYFRLAYESNGFVIYKFDGVEEVRVNDCEIWSITKDLLAQQMKKDIGL